MPDTQNFTDPSGKTFTAEQVAGGALSSQYYRQAGSSVLLDNRGKAITDSNAIGEALKGYGGDLSKIPVLSGFFGAQPTSSVVTTSTAAQNYVDATGTKINGMPPTVFSPPIPQLDSKGNPLTYTWSDGTSGHATADPYGFGAPGYNAANDPRNAAAQTAANQADQTARDTLKQQRDDEIKRLQGEQTSKTADLQRVQDNETGGSTRNLLAMGGYLGNNSFADSYLHSLQLSHEQSMQNLQSQYQSAISQAQAAFTKNDIDLADKMSARADKILADAQDRNDKFLAQTNAILDNQRADAKLQYDMQAAQRDSAKSMQTFIQQNSTGKLPFFAFGQNIYDSQGNIIPPDQYEAMGVSQATVEPVSDQSAFQTTDTRNYNFYAKQMQEKGLTPTDFNSWNLSQKRAGATTINVGGTAVAKEIDNVGKIIAGYPTEWGQAADAVDKAYGTFRAGPNGENIYPVEQRTSTKYDSLFKQSFVLPEKLREVITTMPASVDQTTLNKTRQQFIKENPYLDPTTAGKAFDEAVNKVVAGGGDMSVLKDLGIDPSQLTPAGQ